MARLRKESAFASISGGFRQVELSDTAWQELENEWRKIKCIEPTQQFPQAEIQREMNRYINGILFRDSGQSNVTLITKPEKGKHTRITKFIESIKEAAEAYSDLLDTERETILALPLRCGNLISAVEYFGLLDDYAKMFEALQNPDGHVQTNPFEELTGRIYYIAIDCGGKPTISYGNKRSGASPFLKFILILCRYLNNKLPVEDGRVIGEGKAAEKMVLRALKNAEKRMQKTPKGKK